MPDPSVPPPPDASADSAGSRSGRRGGWPLGLRLALALVLLSFVWSPFLAMLARLSRVAPSLQPTGGNSDFTPPQAPPGVSAPSAPQAGSRPKP